MISPAHWEEERKENFSRVGWLYIVPLTTRHPQTKGTRDKTKGDKENVGDAISVRLKARKMGINITSPGRGTPKFYAPSCVTITRRVG